MAAPVCACARLVVKFTYPEVSLYSRNYPVFDILAPRFPPEMSSSRSVGGWIYSEGALD